MGHLSGDEGFLAIDQDKLRGDRNHPQGDDQGFTQPLCGASCSVLSFSKLEFVNMHFNLHSYDHSRGLLRESSLLVILINII